MTKTISHGENPSQTPLKSSLKGESERSGGNVALPIVDSGLPDPDSRPGSHIVIFDGKCNFCQAQVRNLRRLDCCGGRLSFLSLHDPRVAERYPDLTHDQLMDQMYVIDTEGGRHGGVDAVKFLSRKLPLLWIAAPILHLPGTANLWRWLYGQVAKHRYKLAGKSCDGDVCSVHFDRD